MNPNITNELKEKVQKILEMLRQDLGTLRTGRATPSLIENVSVIVYGGTTKLRIMEVATVGTTDTHTLVLTPFDPSIIQEIEKGIREANLGFNPAVDGQIIRISIPPLSEERRQELIKGMKHKLENGKIMIRQARHDAMGDIKKLHTDKEISDDENTRLEKEVQKIIDESIEKIESMGEQKEEELLKV